MKTFFRMSFVFLVLLIGQETAFAQQKISGTVSDLAGNPIVGAGVLVVGTSSGTITDLDGHFALELEPGAMIQVSCIGYTTIEMMATNEMRIILREDTTFLDEVVVVGYGTLRKSEITGSMARMTSEMIEERPVQNALQAMQGRIAGMNVTTNSRPGELASITIRGNRSLLADNAPLYVIDGIPLTAGSMGDINPSDIESLEILKDASAAAIYGSRGANGVVLVTTKKGKMGRTTINYDGSLTFSQLNSLTKWMNSQELLDYNRQASITGGTYGGHYGTAPDPSVDITKWLNPLQSDYMNFQLDQVYPKDASGNYQMRTSTPDEIAKGFASNVPVYRPEYLLNTDWGATVLRDPAVSHNHLISASSGSKNANIYISLGYLNQQVPMKDQGYERYTAKVSGEVVPFEWFKLGLSLIGTYSEKDYGIINNDGDAHDWKDSYTLAINKMLPWLPAYDSTGKILSVSNASDPVYDNPLRNIDQATNMTYVGSGNISAYGEMDLGKLWKVLSGLNWRTNLGAQYRNTRVGTFYGPQYTNPFRIPHSAPNSAFYSHSVGISWTLENILSYRKTIGDIHSFGFTLVQSAEKYHTENMSDRMYNTVYPTAKWFDVANSNKNTLSVQAGYSAWQRASYMARINYSLYEKYLITATIRYDGASVLAEGNKWDYFPSLALAWRLEQEDFVKRIKWIDQFKLRVGYGVTGNSAVSPYSAMGSIRSDNARIPFGVGGVTVNTPGAKPSAMANYDLGWEKTASYNGGLDFALLNYRISGSLDIYRTNTYDLLMNQTIPVITGFPSIRANVGKSMNRGLEIELNTVNIEAGDFSWESNWTFSTNHDEIVALANGALEDKTNNWYVGAPLRTLFTYNYDRIWQDTPEDNRLMDIYRSLGHNFYPGTYKTKDQEFIITSAEDPNALSVNIKDELGQLTGETVYYKNNGFGVFNDDDKSFYTHSPKWIGGMNQSFTWKNLNLSFFTYFRFGNAYNGILQTIGRRVEHDTWNQMNTTARFAQPIFTQKPISTYATPDLTKGDMIIVRNIALSYSLPKLLLEKMNASSALIYFQVLNPFLFGGELVRVGINPDDMVKGGDGYFQTNNTCITRSFVLGFKFGF